jgi:hypothetical protein
MVMEELVEKLRDTILGIAECSEGGIVNSEAIARSVLSCIEEEVRKYRDTIAFERADGSYYSVEDGVSDEGKERAVDDILAMLRPNPSPSSASA